MNSQEEALCQDFYKDGSQQRQAEKLVCLQAPTLQVMNAPSKDLNRICTTHVADGALKLGCLQ